MRRLPPPRNGLTIQSRLDSGALDQEAFVEHHRIALRALVERRAAPRERPASSYKLGRCDCPVELRPPLEVSAVAWPLLALPDPAALFPPLAVFAVAVPAVLLPPLAVSAVPVPPLFGALVPEAEPCRPAWLLPSARRGRDSGTLLDAGQVRRRGEARDLRALASIGGRARNACRAAPASG